MQKLNLPPYEFKIKSEGGKTYILDIYRKKFVLLTPEEWVRQSFARYLTEEKSYPASLIMTEYSMVLNKTVKRCDILIHKPAGQPAVLVECKAPGIKIIKETFEQIARYNMVFRVRYMMVTNGMKHYCCSIDFNTEEVKFLSEIPSYGDLD